MGKNSNSDKDQRTTLEAKELLTAVPKQYQWNIQRELKLWTICVMVTFTPYIIPTECVERECINYSHQIDKISSLN